MMSTFNGEKFLPALLASVSEQIGVTVRWWIRDDGSTDSTRVILEDESARTDMHVSLGPHKGVVSSFLELLHTCPLDADFYAFCDQDDVWLPTKLEQAVTRLSQCDYGTPLLYCSRLIVVDGQLKELRLTPLPPRPLGLANALGQNGATGCTIVINREALAALQRAAPDARRVAMHDYWAYLVVSALGVIVFDPTPNILYRQHDANVIGSRSGVRALTQRIARALDVQRRLVLTAQEVELERLYGRFMSPANAALLKRHLTGICAPSFRERLRYAMTTEVYRQRHVDDVVMRALIVLGGYRLPKEWTREWQDTRG